MRTQDLFSLVSSLSGVTRFSMLKQNHRETVLEHIGMISCFVFILGTRLNALPGTPINMKSLLEKALVHDWDEIATGDVARPTKYFSKVIRSELAALEAHAIDNISDELLLPGLSHLHAEAKEGAEGYLVGLCDMACAIHRCWEEVILFSNMHLVMVAQRQKTLLREKYKSASLSMNLSSEQWKFLDEFVLGLNHVLNDVVQHGNGALRSLVEDAH